jgi:hypothetical protein
MVEQPFDTVLSFEEWNSRALQHKEVVGSIVNDFLERRSRADKHPVYDFLFTYYQFSPAQLLAWHPPLNTALEVDASSNFQATACSFYKTINNVRYLDVSRITSRIFRQACWIIELCEKVDSRLPRFGCYGLHEWAMVYKSDQVRHSVPLRLSQKDIATVVEENSLVCSHYDAYRFFTPAAAPKNAVKLSSFTRLEYEQAGCLHVNMDLYKWAYKLAPWIGSELIREAFLIALQARQLDMRASPYDLTSYGLTPICIENDEGKIGYQKLQKNLSQSARSIRLKLLAFAKKISSYSSLR